MFLPVAEYAPDLPASAGASALVRNCLPRTASSYGPMPSLAPYSGPLPGRCQGALAVQDGAGNVSVFAGDATRLHRLVADTTSWSDVSKPGGYATAIDQRWEGVLFGNRVVATNFADPIQSFRLGVDAAFSDLAAAAPRARHLAVVRDWLVAGNTFDPTDGAQPQRVWWSAIDDPTSWPAPGSTAAAEAQSDFQDLVGGAGWVQGIVGNLGTADGAIFQERGIVRMSYVGPPAIFAFATAEGARGTPAPGSIAQLGTIVYYLGEDGFYAFDGSASRGIGANKIDKTFFADLDQTHLARVSAAIDPVNKLCFWAYPMEPWERLARYAQLIAGNYGGTTTVTMPAAPRRSVGQGILGGATTGASMGAPFGPWGAAIGAVGGGLLGGFARRTCAGVPSSARTTWADPLRAGLRMPFRGSQGRYSARPVVVSRCISTIIPPRSPTLDTFTLSSRTQRRRLALAAQLVQAAAAIPAAPQPESASVSGIVAREMLRTCRQRSF